MKKIALTFGLIAGGMMSVMMVATASILERFSFETSAVIGYTSIVLAFLMVYFGIRSYRDNALGGVITYWPAFRVGFLITLIASVCYVATWQVVYTRMMPDFGERYTAYEIEKAKKAGATQAELDQQKAESAKFWERYRNPLVRAAYTLIEPLPLGLLITFISAGVLSRRRRTAGTSNAGRIQAAG
jgi:MFS family permease